MNAKAPNAAEIISLLGLTPHPEGGHFRETFRDGTLVTCDTASSSGSDVPETTGEGGDLPRRERCRAASTAIYFLLMRGERSRWHRVDAAEVWHHYGGAPLEISILKSQGDEITRLRLGNDLRASERPQAVVTAGYWQSAATLGEWTLAGCTVAPGFEFSGFELAPAEWQP